MKSLSERFFSKVKKTDGCWEWQAGKDHFGYGRINVSGKNKHSHIVSWEIFNGSILNKLCVLHKCDNPGCVNPDHLFLGTRADNIRDMYNKKREYILKCEENGRSKLTKDLVIKIRSEYEQENIYQWVLAEKYGVSQPVISKIIRNERWIF